MEIQYSFLMLGDFCNFFARESFNSFIEWEWSEIFSFACPAAPVLHESIEAGFPVPDFTNLQLDSIGWKLPEEVEEEFVPSFWEEEIPLDLPSPEAGNQSDFYREMV